MARWNSYFSLTFFITALAGFGAHATQIQALYTAACQRQVGIILDVTPREIKLLNLDGRIVNLRRFEVIYLASFLVDTVPVGEVKNPAEVPMLEVKTLEGDQLVRLVRGWPVNFAKDKIAVLNEHGTEVLIDRASIWRLDYDANLTGFKFRQTSANHYAFEHPYAFASCPVAAERGAFKVYPQQLLNDPISIKRELDRFAEGHAQIHQYDRDQDFYARPEVYLNETQLGLWLTTGSRYGASHERANNFTPYLVNDFSAGPFGFQSEFKTGAGPLAQSIHEESQTQVYYRLKADYFHFTGFVDPNLLLVGERYKWQRGDLDPNDLRANETAFIEFGFDYGRFSLEFYPGGAINFGAQSGGRFHAGTAGLSRFGLRWEGFHWLLNVIAGGGSGSEAYSLDLVRANFEWSPGPSRRFEFSLIGRRMKVDTSDDVTALPFRVRSESATAAAYGHVRFRRRYWAGAMLAIENVRTSYASSGSVGAAPGATQTQNRVFPKVGALISLSF